MAINHGRWTRNCIECAVWFVLAAEAKKRGSLHQQGALTETVETLFVHVMMTE